MAGKKKAHSKKKCVKKPAKKKASVQKKKTSRPKMQVDFVRYLLHDPNNPTEACRKAGYSEKTARHKASQLLATPWIKELYEKCLEERAERLSIKSDEIIHGLKCTANANLYDFCRLKEDGSLWTDDEGEVALNMSRVTRDQMAGLASIKRKTVTDKDGNVERTTEIRLKPTTPAQKLLGDHIGMWSKDEESGGGDTIINVFSAIPGAPGSKVHERK